MNQSRKWLVSRGIPLVAVALASWTIGSRTDAGPPGGTDIPVNEKLAPSEIKSDFEQLYQQLKESHFNLYARVSKPAYDRLYRRMSAEFTEPLPPLEITRRFQRFTAFGRVAHARIDNSYGVFRQYMAGGGKAFPFALRIVRGRLFVAENKSGVSAILPGDEIIAIEGKPASWWLDRCGRNLAADTRYMAEALMELDLPMLLWLEAGPVGQFRLQLRHPNGGKHRETVRARTSEEMQLAAAGQPPRLDLGRSDRTWRMLDGRIGYLRPGGFYNTDPAATDMYDNAGFRRFIDGALESLIAKEARALLIDLRDNPGGDSSFSDLMVSWFADKPYRFNSAFLIKVSPQAVRSNAERLPSSAPGSISHQFAALYARARPGTVVRFDTPYTRPRPGRRYTGRVYLLINRNSYSNAVAVAATVQDYAFGTVVGEETSDLATTYGAMESFTLPRTALKVGFPKARIVRPSGDTADRGVRPDVKIETPILEGPEDPVLQRAAAVARAALGPHRRSG
jgi:hypothetical protein